MTDTAVTSLNDAKAMRAMGAPLSTPVTEGKFSPRAEKQINAAYTAALTFSNRVRALLANKNRSAFFAMRRAHDKLARLIAEAEADAEWKENADGTREMVNTEQIAVGLFVGRLMMCVAGWQELFDEADAASEAGEAFLITGEHLNALWPCNGVKLGGNEAKS